MYLFFSLWNFKKITLYLNGVDSIGSYFDKCVILWYNIIILYLKCINSNGTYFDEYIILWHPLILLNYRFTLKSQYRPGQGCMENDSCL